jgi:peptidoglycan-associated lipoprotein
MKRKIQMFVIFFIAASLITLGGASCAKKQVKVETPVVDNSAADAAKKKAEEEAAAAAAKKKADEQAAAAAAKKKAEEEAAAAAKKRAEAEAAQKMLQDQINAVESEKIYFDYDKADLKAEAQTALEKKAKFLQANSTYSLAIEGNCDERGTNEYNLALGQRRADAAKNFLSSLGISADRITANTYGEEKPVDMGHDEAAWSQNRRDEFKLTK